MGCRCSGNTAMLNATMHGVAAVVHESVVGDNVSIVLDEDDNVVRLKGFRTAPNGSIPFRTAEGLTWVLPADLFSNLDEWATQNDLQELVQSINLIKIRLDTLEARANLDQANLSLFNNRLDTLENKVDTGGVSFTTINGGSANG